MAEQNENPTTPVFSLEKIYIKDVSYEAPAVPHAFLVAEPPQIGVELSLDHSALDTAQGVFEVVLTVTVTAAREDKTVFLVELQQGGLFRIQESTASFCARRSRSIARTCCCRLRARPSAISQQGRVPADAAAANQLSDTVRASSRRRPRPSRPRRSAAASVGAAPGTRIIK